MINMSEISKILEFQNTWWKNPEYLKVEFTKRETYNEIKPFLNEPQIIAITGIRRVGKTTTLYKLIEDYIDAGINSRNILYVSFEELKKIKLRTIIEEYEILHNKQIMNEKIYFFFDEIQKVDNWEEQLKSIYDVYKLKKNIKIFISGSESLFIRTKSKETLAGRIYEFKMNPLSFTEYLSFKNKNYDNINLYEKEIIQEFNNFIITQGFPELVEKTNNPKIIQEYTSNIIQKIIFKDITQQFRIKNTAGLESIIRIISNAPGQIIDQADLGRELGMTRQIVSDYLRYLEDSFLLRKLYNYSNNFRKTEKKLKKYYPIILSPMILLDENELIKSKVFESIVVTQLQAEFFWRDNYKNEVDIIQRIDKKIIPIEIKYGKIETSGIVRFLEANKLQEGYIISYKEEATLKEKGKTIYVVPAWKYLLNKNKYIKK